VFLSPQYTDSNRLITNLLEKGLTCKALSLHDCSIDTIDKNSLYIVNNFDSKKDEHLKLLNKILQETSYKVIVINDEPIYQNGIEVKVKWNKIEPAITEPNNNRCL
jgi:hypothetical protein